MRRPCLRVEVFPIRRPRSSEGRSVPRFGNTRAFRCLRFMYASYNSHVRRWTGQLLLAFSLSSCGTCLPAVEQERCFPKRPSVSCQDTLAAGYNSASKNAGPYDVQVVVPQGGDEKAKSVNIRIFKPIFDDVTTFGVDSSNRSKSTQNVVIIWGNGVSSIKNPDNYNELLRHLASYGFIVVQEQSKIKFDFSESIPSASFSAFIQWAMKQSDIPENNWIFVAAGKSRGGSQAHSFAASKRFRKKIDGVICIGGCGIGVLGIFPPMDNKKNSLYITGEKDWAAWKVKQSFCAGGGNKQYFERAHQPNISGGYDFGTHLGHDQDPLVRNLTTDWLRCRYHSDEDACAAVKGATPSGADWVKIVHHTR